MGPACRVDLENTSVFVDFDGAVTTVDTGVHLLERFAPAAWQSIVEEYERGEIGSRVCLLDEWELLPADEETLRNAVREVEVDAHAAAFVNALRAAGAEVVIVSDGFGFYATEVAAQLGVPVLTNSVDWESGRLEFPHEDRCCACTSCGVCKQAPIKDAHHAGRATVLVGEAVSDYKAALLADVVFAKGGLARWCARQGVAFEPFETLADVKRALLSRPGLAPSVGESS